MARAAKAYQLPAEQDAPLSAGDSRQMPDTPLPEPPRAPEPHPVVQYIRNTGGGLSVLGLAGILPGPRFYWWGVSFLNLGLLLLLIEALFENWRLRYRLLVACAWLVLIVLFNLKVVMLPEPIVVQVMAYDGNYQGGEDVYGIKWRKEMSELRLRFSNPTDRNYDNLDINFITDGAIMDVKEMTSLNNCKFIPVFVRDINAHGYATTKNGDTVATVTHVATTREYRIRCDSLPSFGRLEFVVAVVHLKPQRFKPEDLQHLGFFFGGADDIFASRSKAKWVWISGQYDALNRPFDWKYTYAVR